MEPQPACKSLVLDAGPLLSLSPLRGLAERYLTVPQVLSELKDKNAREHFERLGFSAGVKIEVREPDAASLSQVIQFAKKTGDYSVLSHADLCVIALTLSLDAQGKAEEAAQIVSKSTQSAVDADSTLHDVPSARDASGEPTPDEQDTQPDLPTQIVDDSTAEDGDSVPQEGALEIGKEEPPSSSEAELDECAEREPVEVSLESISDNFLSPETASQPPQVATFVDNRASHNAPVFDDPSDEDDGEGEWITPDNVDLYKSRALDLFPATNASNSFTTVSRKKGRGRGRGRKNQLSGTSSDTGPKKPIGVGCMTADFAMQNVLLQMNLNLVGIEGKRIEKVKTWILRCHACFKICKDSSKKFCPSCGNPSLLRTSVTVKTPTADDSSPALQVHLKKNFQYHTRGTKYSIPAPKHGSSKKGTGEGLILREDQTEYMRAKKQETGRRQREEKKLVQQSLAAVSSGGTAGVRLGSWMDPDWVPEMLCVGIGGKGRRAPDSRVPVGPDGMPVIGHGRKNPNERGRKR